MPERPDPNLDLDERTAFLARKWFAEARQKELDENIAEPQRRSRPRAGIDGSLWDWLAGEGDSDAGDE